MAKFNLIYRPINSLGKESVIPTLFKDACEKQGVEFNGIDITALGKEFTLSDLPVLGKGDLLYRSAVSSDAQIAERLMANGDVTTFYTDWKSVYTSRAASWYIHKKFNLPVVPTYPSIPSTKEELRECVEKLGSFPIIVKVLGGSLGVGVMRIDSIKSLQSILDYLSTTNASVLLRKYIPHEYYVRAVVVGDKVVASKAAYVLEGEFRTNTIDSPKRTREPKVLPIELQEKVVQAVRLLGIETGGVDLLFDKDNNPFIAETNFPNDFSTAQKITGIDVAGEMISYLVEKSKR